MITITRRQARGLRGIFRRCALGITRRSSIAPLVLRAEGTQLRAQYRYASLAVEYVEPGSYAPEGTVTLPLDALADFEGRAESPVTLVAETPDRTVVRWGDHGIPLSREFDVPAFDQEGNFPDCPRSWTDLPEGLLDALAEASRTTADDSTRYALNCIQLRGATREIVATDGHQVLIAGGFPFPWTDAVLIRDSPVLGSRELPGDQPVRIAKTDTHVVLRAGRWTLYFEVQTEARFPRVDQVIPDAEAVATRLRLDASDAAFLGEALGRLPAADEQFSPATVDCNGKVAIRARAADQTTVTELVLGRSRYTGSPVRFNTDRHFLARALRLGFPEIGIVDARTPVVCRDQHRIYCWQPLSHESALEPTDDVIRIDSASTTTDKPIPRDEPPRARTTMRKPARVTGDAGQANGVTNGQIHREPEGPMNGTACAQTNGPANGHAVPENTEPTSLAALIQEAEALHETISSIKTRAGRLIVTLRRYRRREKLVASTLASLRQLKLTEASR
jgi:hypothetical protein